MTDTTSNRIDRVRGGERIASLDVIRGIAILFILFMNIPWMGGYEFALFDPRHPTWTDADYWATLVTKVWLEGTQRGLLELLFGAGIIIMARKAMTPDGPVAVADLHYRRNLWLIVLGLVNAFVLLWPGDILFVYGIAAIFLFPFRTLSSKGLFGFAGLLIGGLLVYSAGEYRANSAEQAAGQRIAATQARGATISADDRKTLDDYRAGIDRRTQMPADNAKARTKIAEADAARHGSLADYWAYQAQGWMWLVTKWFWVIEAEIMATMLIGMALYKLGVIQGTARTRVYWGLLVAGYGVGFALRGTGMAAELAFRPGIHWQAHVVDISRLAVTFGHLGLIHLALRAAGGRALLKPFEAAGRMPLTVYLFTSLLMMWVIFAPWGLDWFGRFGMAWLMAIAGVVIVGEIAAANLWLRHYHNGPMEWLWKSLAYERREPFRKERGTRPDAVPSPI
jgi:uncharacterized protein